MHEVKNTLQECSRFLGGFLRHSCTSPNPHQSSSANSHFLCCPAPSLLLQIRANFRGKRFKHRRTWCCTSRTCNSLTGMTHTRAEHRFVPFVFISIVYSIGSIRKDCFQSLQHWSLSMFDQFLPWHLY